MSEEPITIRVRRQSASHSGLLLSAPISLAFRAHISCFPRPYLLLPAPISHQLWQPLLLLRLRSKLINRMHDQRTLHRHSRTVARINTLDFARYQPVGRVACADTAIALDRRAQQARLSHLAHDGAVKLLITEGVAHARCQLLSAKGSRCVADHSLLFGQETVQLQWVGYLH